MNEYSYLGNYYACSSCALFVDFNGHRGCNAHGKRRELKQKVILPDGKVPRAACPDHQPKEGGA